MLDAFALVKRLAADYRTMTDAYDEELLAAHNAGHGTVQGIEHLRKANAMAPYVLDLLTRYQASVEALAGAIANELDQESRVHSSRRTAGVRTWANAPKPSRFGSNTRSSAPAGKTP